MNTCLKEKLENNIVDAIKPVRPEELKKFESWFDELIRWADENEISEEKLPRDKGNLLDLTVLDLRENQLRNIPESIGILRKLESLDLSVNQLTTLPQSIGQLSNLLVLISQKNQLTTLHQSIGNLSKLRLLSLSENKLNSLPESIGQLSNLIILDSAKNKLTTFPQSIVRLSNLSELYLRYNKIGTLPENIRNLSKLSILSISDNQLTTLPQSIGQLSNLSELYLRDNRLTTLHQSIGNLSNLTELAIGGNRVNNIPVGIRRISKITGLESQLVNPIVEKSNASFVDKDLSIIDKLYGTVDHITHLSNLESILANGLLSHNNQYKKVDISNIQVNDRRNKLEPIYKRNIHDYVPFYMNARNAMLYRNQKEYGNIIIILGFRTKLVLSEDVVFTDGNAASDRTRYFNDINRLFELDWSSIRSDQWYFDGYTDEEIKRKMMAEALVYERVDISFLERIYCQNHIVKLFIEQNYSLGHVKVETKQSMFFERLIRV